MGPTASGKTHLAMRLQDVLNGEIVSVDSALIYKGMDIGSAKPSATELKRYPHHLINIREPNQTYSAAEFRSDALRLMDDISARGKTPILVGGTMMYFRLLIEGISHLPPASATIRTEIDKLAAEHGWPYVHKMLAQVDPEAAARIHATDPQRIQRAYEVYQLTGRSLSALHAEQKQSADQQLSHQLLQFAIAPEQRRVLHQRIERRFLQMCASGFADEVAGLMARGDLSLALPAMRCVGYRQMWQYLDGDYDYQTMLDKGVAATRQLAKRQLTWLRGWQDLNWLITHQGQAQLSNDENAEEIVDQLLKSALAIINKQLNY